MAHTNTLQQTITHYYPTPGPSRPASACAQHLLDPGRSVQVCVRNNPPPFAQVNTPGQPIQVLPTLVSHPLSYNFRPFRAGALIGADQLWTQPNPDERERLLGFNTAAPFPASMHPSTRAPNISEQQRHAITGKAMSPLQLLHILRSIAHTHQPLQPAPSPIWGDPPHPPGPLLQIGEGPAAPGASSSPPTQAAAPTPTAPEDTNPASDSTPHAAVTTRSRLQRNTTANPAEDPEYELVPSPDGTIQHRPLRSMSAPQPDAVQAEVEQGEPLQPGEISPHPDEATPIQEHNP